VLVAGRELREVEPDLTPDRFEVWHAVLHSHLEPTEVLLDHVVGQPCSRLLIFSKTHSPPSVSSATRCDSSFCSVLDILAHPTITFLLSRKRLIYQALGFFY
jgi:hypothetical protein